MKINRVFLALLILSFVANGGLIWYLLNKPPITTSPPHLVSQNTLLPIEMTPVVVQKTNNTHISITNTIFSTNRAIETIYFSNITDANPYIDELNKYRTNSFAVESVTNELTKISLVNRWCLISPEIKTIERFKASDHLLRIGAAYSPDRNIQASIGYSQKLIGIGRFAIYPGGEVIINTTVFSDNPLKGIGFGLSGTIGF
jgi:hypothetical protein